MNEAYSGKQLLRDAKLMGVGCGSIAGFTLIAPIVGYFFLRVVFGVTRKDSSAMWGLAALEPFFRSTLPSLPALWIAYGIAFILLGRFTDSPAISASASPFIAIILYLLTVCLVWLATGGGRVVTT